MRRKVVYHEGCYSPFVNIANLNRAIKRLLTSIDIDECSIVKGSKGGRLKLQTMTLHKRRH